MSRNKSVNFWQHTTNMIAHTSITAIDSHMQNWNCESFKVRVTMSQDVNSNANFANLHYNTVQIGKLGIAKLEIRIGSSQVQCSRPAFSRSTQLDRPSQAKTCESGWQLGLAAWARCLRLSFLKEAARNIRNIFETFETFCTSTLSTKLLGHGPHLPTLRLSPTFSDSPMCLGVPGDALPGARLMLRLPEPNSQTQSANSHGPHLENNYFMQTYAKLCKPFPCRLRKLRPSILPGMLAGHRLPFKDCIFGKSIRQARAPQAMSPASEIDAAVVAAPNASP